MKRILSIVVGIVLLVSMFSVAFADTQVSPRASQVIDETVVGIRFSGGRVYGAGQITTVSTADKLGISAISIYEYNSGSWTRIASASSKYAYGTFSHSYTLSAPATEGKTYKVNVSFYGKIGSLTDTHSQSITKTY